MSEKEVSEHVSCGMCFALVSTCRLFMITEYKSADKVLSK